MVRVAAGRRLLLPLLMLAGASLLIAVWAGLFRAGWPFETLFGHHPMAHGPLLVCGFLGTVIGLEKATAVERWWAYLAPLASGLGALCLVVIASPSVAQPAFVAASALLVIVFVAILRRRVDLAEIIMLSGAAAWLVGNVTWASGQSIPRVASWWMAFPVLTIVGERLELSRLVRKPNWAVAALVSALGVYVVGVATTPRAMDLALRLQGIGLLLVALWLLRFDFARRTLKVPGVHRFTALCLLSGFVWLAVGGIAALAWGVSIQGLRYDALVHSILLGFVFGMILGHAPIIAPMLLRRRIRFERLFFVPLIVLQLSLAVRFVSDLAEWLPGRAWGALFNALALVVFLVSVVRGVLRGEAV